MSGAFTGLDVPDTVTALQFVNMEDRYIYDAAISANSYQLKLRNGTYEVKAEAGDYQTVSILSLKIRQSQEICYF